MSQKGKIEKSWGFEGLFVSEDKYAAKILIIREGESTPYLYNKIREKTVFVLQGIVIITLDDSSGLLNEGERKHIPPKTKHKLHAIQGDATIIEVGTKIEDDEIVIEA